MNEKKNKLAPALLKIFAPKPKVHVLKWKIPEARFIAPLEDAAPAIAALKKSAVFTGGGQFNDVVYVKEFGENVFAYFFVRTDAKTQEEKLVFEGYMLEEEEQLNLSVESGYRMRESLKQMGYEEAFSRDFTEWRFKYGTLTAVVYDVAGFGCFLEVAVPATKIAKAREALEKTALKLFEKIGVSKEEVIPTDVTTLQLIMSRQEK
ncbi:MAG: hypothetical protein ACP5O3_00525 [Candidatus Micrarchaeia archaeon]|jgi:adenylate cyclase class IV